MTKSKKMKEDLHSVADDIIQVGLFFIMYYLFKLKIAISDRYKRKKQFKIQDKTYPFFIFKMSTK